MTNYYGLFPAMPFKVYFYLLNFFTLFLIFKKESYDLLLFTFCTFYTFHIHLSNSGMSKLYTYHHLQNKANTSHAGQMEHKQNA